MDERSEFEKLQFDNEVQIACNVELATENAALAKHVERLEKVIEDLLAAAEAAKAALEDK